MASGARPAGGRSGRSSTRRLDNAKSARPRSPARRTGYTAGISPSSGSDGCGVTSVTSSGSTGNNALARDAQSHATGHEYRQAGTGDQSSPPWGRGLEEGAPMLSRTCRARRPRRQARTVSTSGRPLISRRPSAPQRQADEVQGPDRRNGTTRLIGKIRRGRLRDATASRVLPTPRVRSASRVGRRPAAVPQWSPRPRSSAENSVSDLEEGFRVRPRGWAVGSGETRLREPSRVLQ
jgi:hypothetical protein